MKIQTDKLLSAIRSALPATEKHVGMSTSCFLLASVGGKLNMTGDNLDQRIVATADCEGDLEAHCVNAKYLSNLVQCANGEVSLEHKSGRLLFRSGDTKAELPTLLAEDFPACPKDKMVKQGVNCSDLSEMVKSVAWAASTDTQRYILNSVYVEATKKGLTTISSDGRALASSSKPAISASFSALIARKAASGLITAMEQKGAELILSDNRIGVTYDSGEFSCRLLEGDFPVSGTMCYFSMAGKSLGSLPKQQLLEALRACVALCSSEWSAVVDLNFTKKSLHLSFKDAKSQGFEADIPGKFEPKQLSINAYSFVPCLEQFKADSIPVEFVADCSGVRMKEGDLVVINSLMKPVEERK